MSAATVSRDLRSHFLGLANPTRLAILALLAGGELPASDLARELRLSQPLLSWHLRIMRRAGLVGTRRTGREIHCALDRDRIRQLQTEFNHLIEQPVTAPRPAGFATQLVTEEIANAS